MEEKLKIVVDGEERKSCDPTYINVQVSFRLSDKMDEETLRYLLRKAKDNIVTHISKNYEVYSCQLSEKICNEKGYSTMVPDLFNEVFGDKYHCEIDGEADFDSAMKNMNIHRDELAAKCDAIVVLLTESVGNVFTEVLNITKNSGKTVLLID